MSPSYTPPAREPRPNFRGERPNPGEMGEPGLRPGAREPVGPREGPGEPRPRPVREGPHLQTPPVPNAQFKSFSPQEVAERRARFDKRQTEYARSNTTVNPFRPTAPSGNQFV